MTDETFGPLLEAARSGAEWAWAELYRELAGPVTGYLASRGSPEPEDVTSEVFLQVARHVNSFSGDLSQFRSWVFVIAHRRLLDERRKLGRRPRMVEIELEIPAGDVEVEALEKLTTARLRDTFEQLSEGQRDVLALRIIAGLTLAETAEVVGKKVGAVKAIQRRAIESLRAKLDSEGVSM
jgi:RNA polymerase sigma factor (sigma-70 family)